MLLAIFILLLLNLTLLILLGGILMAVSRQQFDTDFGAENTALAAYVALVGRLLTAYQTAIQGEDFTQEDQAAVASTASIATSTQAINAAGIQ
jgi:hypothetical protein